MSKHSLPFKLQSWKFQFICLTSIKPYTLLFAVPRLLNTVGENKAIIWISANYLVSRWFFSRARQFFSSPWFCSLSKFSYLSFLNKTNNLYFLFYNYIFLFLEKIICLLIYRDIFTLFCIIVLNFCIYKHLILSPFEIINLFFSLLFTDPSPSKITRSFLVSYLRSNFS